MARTVVNLDDRLVREAMHLTRMTRKVDVVNEALRVLVRQRRALGLFEELSGRVRWSGDPDEMRHRRDRELDRELGPG